MLGIFVINFLKYLYGYKKDKIKKFNQRWNIKEASKSHENELSDFKTRIKNIFPENIDKCISKKDKNLLCQYFGLESSYSYSLMGYFNTMDNEIEIYRFLEVLFSSDFNVTLFKMPDGSHPSQIKIKGHYFEELTEAISFSRLNLSITKFGENDEIIFYPKGEELLDNEIVNNILSFLSGASSDHFQQALNFYLAKNFIKSGESIRRTLEEFLRQKLLNTKGLKANISDLTSRLKLLNTPPQVRSIIMQIFSQSDEYFNENTKHNDGDLNDPDTEFLIYQAGLLMRYISKVIK